MRLILFSFAFNPTTKELTYTGNINPPEIGLPVALKILQDALISQAQQKGNDVKKQTKRKEAESEKGS